MIITGIINATEAGCPPRRGNGTAIAIDCCNHGGGSYGGKGRSGTPNTNDIRCQETQETCDKGVRSPFGNRVDMVAFQGSGGGGPNGASGGGAIWLHTSDTLTMDATIEANGGNARTVQESSYGDGGGSGGAISVTTSKILATPDTVLSVAGGFGNFGGGGGSGGWIYGIIKGQIQDMLTQIIQLDGMVSLISVLDLIITENNLLEYGNFKNHMILILGVLAMMSDQKEWKEYSELLEQ
eukprot:CAMPEP_0197019072 /NCGR_PEP_ID=MMETSP1380-20130617/80471_1 /TAXON_ID=5936 /ORGANISM="Euplotes crassus, Strain CT5" /LENGTH=238 /DNA_ID=CAMNT_0042446405 /DNA_START=1909 /DNA_END=2626 /DNA_ORIENTATION=-